MTIHDCGTEVPPGAIVCPGCARTIGIESTLPLMQARSEAPARREPSPTAACPTCRRPVLPGAAECDFCGTKLTTGGAGPVAAAVLVLPGGFSADLPEGRPVELGRETGPDEIRSVLAGFDAVSRRHAELLLSAGRLRVRDLGSTNGTSVEGRPATETVPVEVVLDRQVTVGLGRELILSVAPRTAGGYR